MAQAGRCGLIASQVANTSGCCGGTRPAPIGSMRLGVYWTAPSELSRLAPPSWNVPPAMVKYGSVSGRFDGSGVFEKPCSGMFGKPGCDDGGKYGTCEKLLPNMSGNWAASTWRTW